MAERFYAALWTHRMGYLGFTLALLVTTVLTLYLLLERLVLRPLTQLRTLAVRVGQGDLAVNPERVEAVGEIRELAGEFGAMARQLRQFYGELERRVQERAAALQEANR